MKKFVLSVILTLSAATLSAQSYDKGGYWAVELSDYFVPSKRAFSNEIAFQSQSLGVKFGYNFTPRISAAVGVAASSALFNENGVRTFAVPLEVNLAADYELFKINNTAVRLELNGAGSVVSDNGWKYLAYGAQLKFALPASGQIRPVVGLGARYYDSLNAAYANRWTAGISLTFLFNLGGDYRVRGADSLND